VYQLGTIGFDFVYVLFHFIIFYFSSVLTVRFYDKYNQILNIINLLENCPQLRNEVRLTMLGFGIGLGVGNWGKVVGWVRV